MRQLIVVVGLGLLTTALGCNKGSAPTQVGSSDPSKPQVGSGESNKYPVTAEKTGIFICCAECEKQVKETLGKVDGVGAVTCDLKNKVVTYKAKNGAAAKAGDSALGKAGFGGKYKDDAPEDAGRTFFYVGDRLGGGAPVEQVTLKQVHVCCEGCEKAIRELYKDAEVTFEGTGPQKDVKLKGKNLSDAAAWNAIRKAGFNPQD